MSRIDYPSDADEVKVMRLVRGENAAKARRLAAPPPRIAQKVIFDARAEIDRVATKDVVETYMVALIAATRRPAEYGDKLEGLDRSRRQPARLAGARPDARASMPGCKGRDYVMPEDVQAVVHDCLRHRISLSYEASADGVTADEVIDEIVKQVAVAA